MDGIQYFPGTASIRGDLQIGKIVEFFQLIPGLEFQRGLIQTAQIERSSQGEFGFISTIGILGIFTARWIGRG